MKKDKKRKAALSERTKTDSLRFQTRFGLEQLGVKEGDMLMELAKAEIEFISELGLTEDLLDIKNLMDSVRAELQVEPTPEAGDFCTSITAIALKIASLPILEDLKMPLSWQDQLNKKLLTIYFPENRRNAVVNWAKANGFNTSTYLGQPIVKFRKLFILIGRTRG